MKHSAKRALLLPAWLERKLYLAGGGLFCPWPAAAVVEADGRRGAFFWPRAARERCGRLALGEHRWELWPL